MQASLNIFPKTKIAFINILNEFRLDNNFIDLEYSSDKKELELQVLLHGYKILENTLDDYKFESGELSYLRIRKYKLKQIS